MPAEIRAYECWLVQREGSEWVRIPGSETKVLASTGRQARMQVSAARSGLTIKCIRSRKLSQREARILAGPTQTEALRATFPGKPIHVSSSDNKLLHCMASELSPGQ